ncbi:hypothetical protein PVAP13_8KG074351 [Panicum virgatum]|uniref:Uncharacterized protein n=1 Tax=Panicum virgatum TaxID=38727 RepID=A0A8T0PE97_PANVG|nr:hypothetical protein PVAP13_8KG074351 [Panicum virgatum]
MLAYLAGAEEAEEQKRAEQGKPLDLDAAVGGRLEPEPVSPDDAGAAAADEVGRAGDEDVVVAGGPAADLPADAAVDPDLHDEVPVGDVLPHGVGEERREGDVRAGQDGRPDVDVAVALVHRREPGRERDLLVLVGGVDVEAVVVHADAAVGVVGGDGELRRRGEQRRGAVGEVELAERGVLEDEARVRGAEDEVDDERDEADEEGEEQEDAQQAPERLLELVVAVVAAVLAHGCDGPCCWSCVCWWRRL